MKFHEITAAEISPADFDIAIRRGHAAGGRSSGRTRAGGMGSGCSMRHNRRRRMRRRATLTQNLTGFGCIVVNREIEVLKPPKFSPAAQKLK